MYISLSPIPMMLIPTTVNPASPLTIITPVTCFVSPRAILEMTELEEAKAYLDYVHRHCMTAVQPVIRMVLCRRFVQETNSDTDPMELYQRARRIRPITELKDMDPVSRARVHFTLSIPVKQTDFDFLEQLRENAEVDLDTEQRIIKFWSNDGSVKLQGSHKRKDKDGYVANASRRSKRGARDDSDDEGEGEEEDDDPTYPAQKKQRGGAVRGLIPTGMGAGTSSFVQGRLSPAAQGEPSTSGASMLGAHTPVAHSDQADYPTQGAPIGENRAGTVSVGAQAAAQGAASAQEVVEHARRTESPVETNEAQHSRSGGQPADTSKAQS
ncbi:unnamed protein product [Caenorhabditis brenneri]